MSFYRVLEERHRGPRELIRSRLEVYLPYLARVRVEYAGAPVVDLGCGRGEWLELLRDHNIVALGVDTDEGMLQACLDRQLPATNADALDFLQGLPDRHCLAVSAFHLVEHLRFEDLLALVREALRVLVPGGLLILETPNPENLSVGSCSFYLDPTHVHPLPPGLLVLLPEYFGAVRSLVFRLQESPELALKAEVGLCDVLWGASPDYAVVAQAPAPAEVLARIGLPESGRPGLGMAELAVRYDARFSENVSAARCAEQSARRAEEAAALALRKLEVLEQSVAQYQQELLSVYASRSWRITRPLRAGIGLARCVRTGASGAVSRVVRGVVNRIRRYPRFFFLLRAGVMRYPPLAKRLRGCLERGEQVPDARFSPMEGDLPMSSRARSIYAALRASIKPGEPW